MSPETNPVDTYLLEAEDLLEQIEQIVLGLHEHGDTEAVNQLFRAFHTIKGSGAMFGFDRIADFTHHIETALDRVRDGVLPLSRELTELILAARDHIHAMLSAPHPTGALDEARERIIAALGTLLGRPEINEPTPPPRPPHHQDPKAGRSTIWLIRFHPDPDLMVNGTNPVWLLDALRALGACEVTGHADLVPSLEDIQPDRCYIWWEVRLETDAGRDAIRDVFIFVEDGSQIQIDEADEIPLAARQVLGEVRSNTAPENRQATHKQQVADSTVRVPAEKLDSLVNLVGELVMNQSRLTQAAAHFGSSELASPVEEIERLVAELRDNVLGIRMMPIGRTFSRFKRLVHDLSGELNKEIDLITEGAETELDKTVLDQLGDPLVHLIRNCIDHGIETREDREHCGKPARGTIRLSALHVGSNVVVSIADDGRGLDTSAIRAKAVERGLVAPDASPSDREIFNLVFVPGFSTARAVTEVSGRGVGMDVVRRQIEALRGSVAIESQPGRGTKISLTLPLTLAIIDGLLVEVERELFILPMVLVTENVELPIRTRSRNNGRNIVAVRGELVPYIDLRELFGMSGRPPEIGKVVIVRHEDTRVGVAVDRVVGTHQTVIQSLGRLYRSVEVASGATIMGDGTVSLILDITRLIHFADRRCRTQETRRCCVSEAVVSDG